MNSTARPAPGWASAHDLVRVGPPVAASESVAAERSLVIETLNRYCWGYDQRDADVFAGCFTEDLLFEGSIGGTEIVEPVEGRGAFIEYLEGFWDEQPDQRRHLAMNPVVNDLDGESATVLSYLLLTTAEDGAMRPMTTGFYKAAMVKQDGVWRIRHFFVGFDTPY